MKAQAYKRNNKTSCYPEIFHKDNEKHRKQLIKILINRKMIERYRAGLFNNYFLRSFFTANKRDKRYGRRTYL